LPFLVIVTIIVGVILAKRERGDAESFINVDSRLEPMVRTVEHSDDSFRQKKLNKIVRVALPGGLIGAITINPRKALEQTIQKHNTAGWNCHQIIFHTTHNLFMVVLQVLLLVVTIGLWTFGAGYLLLFEKDNTDYSSREGD
jgi:hypothetical protein